MQLPSDLEKRIRIFLIKIPPEEKTLEKILLRLLKTDSNLIDFSLIKSRLTDSFSGHLIFQDGRDIQFHFYFSKKGFYRIDYVDMNNPDDFKTMEIK